MTNLESTNSNSIAKSDIQSAIVLENRLLAFHSCLGLIIKRIKGNSSFVIILQRQKSGMTDNDKLLCSVSLSIVGDGVYQLDKCRPRPLFHEINELVKILNTTKSCQQFVVDLRKFAMNKYKFSH